ncbi:MAG: hypothetical protein RIT37_227 [Bacteroidota bacterium]
MIILTATHKEQIETLALRFFMDIYALIWRSHAQDDAFDQQAFNERMPALFTWLTQLKSQSKLLACGGGGFETSPGGLTIIYAESPEEAIAIANQSPLADMGTTEIMFWGLFHANLRMNLDDPRLQ